MSDEHYTSEDEGKVGTIGSIEEARKAHHLATADPERDGVLTGPEHEEKYGLERAADSKATIEAQEAASSGLGEIETAEAPRASKPSSK